MSTALYASGTLLTWVGWALLFGAMWHSFQGMLAPAGLERNSSRRRGFIWGSLSLVAFAIGLWTISRTEPSADLWQIPLVWPVLPFAGWAALAAMVGASVRVAQAIQTPVGVEAKARWGAAGVWAIALVGFLLLWRFDGFDLEILRGAVDVSPAFLISVVLLIGAAIFAMLWASRFAKSRGLATGAVTHMALLAGTVIFGLPFAYLLITSFKEDRDMSSAEGIIWVPRVQLEVEHFDRNNPLYEGRHEATTVTGTVIERLGGDRVKIDILRPMAMRGVTFETSLAQLKEVPRMAPIVTGRLDDVPVRGKVVENMEDGRQRVQVMEPAHMKDKVFVALPNEVEPVREVGLKWSNYTEALEYLPPETGKGLVYLKNTLILVVLGVIGTILSSAVVAYAFSRLKFPGRNALFILMLSTMMLPAAVTLLPQFLIFRGLGWIDTLYPLWVPAFFGSAFNIFLLRQFFMTIPMELEDAAKIDGSSYPRTFWSVMLPQIKPALAVIAIWTFMGAWNNFMGPLIYVNTPENMPISYALQLYQSDRGAEPGLLMAFTVMSVLPVLALFFFAQKYFIEGVTLSGLGGR